MLRLASAWRWTKRRPHRLHPVRACGCFLAQELYTIIGPVWVITHEGVKISPGHYPPVFRRHLPRAPARSKLGVLPAGSPWTNRSSQRDAVVGRAGSLRRQTRRL